MGKSKRLSDEARPPKTPKKKAELDKTQRNIAIMAEHASETIKELSKPFVARGSDSDSEDEESNYDQDDLRTYIRTLPTSESIKGMFQELTTTIKTELLEIKSDIRQVFNRLDSIEEASEKVIQHASHLENKVKSQQKEIYDLHLHIDDLENRSRRNNLRIKGLSEQVEDKDITEVLTQIFLELLGKEEPQDLGIERAHRVFRPRHVASETPRDVLCYLLSFRLKEEILKKARFAKKIEYEGGEITIFQDISKFTLDRRRQLTPLTKVLRERNLKYRWLYPFGILVTHNSRPFTIRSPDDLSLVLPKLNLGQIDIPDWTASDSSDVYPGLPVIDKWERITTPRQRQSKAQDSPFPRAPRKNLRGLPPD